MHLLNILEISEFWVDLIETYEPYHIIQKQIMFSRGSTIFYIYDLILYGVQGRRWGGDMVYLSPPTLKEGGHNMQSPPQLLIQQ